MAIFQVATNTPPKSEIIAEWMETQPWGSAGVSIEIVGSFHLEDPEGEVGMQVHIVAVGGRLIQVPLTYRAEQAPDLAEAFLAVMHHSVLGPRFVYDGFGDHKLVSTVAGVAACGYGQSLGFASVEGRWQAWPESARVCGFGSVDGRVLVDGFERVSSTATEDTMRNERLELTMFRALAHRPAPPIGMAATWPGQSDAMVLASVCER